MPAIIQMPVWVTTAYKRHKLMTFSFACCKIYPSFFDKFDLLIYKSIFFTICFWVLSLYAEEFLPNHVAYWVIFAGSSRTENRTERHVTVDVAHTYTRSLTYGVLHLFSYKCRDFFAFLFASAKFLFFPH